MTETKKGTTGKYPPHLKVVSDGDWTSPVKPSDGDGGDGDNMEPRIAKLESDVSHIQEILRNIRDDVRDLRNWGIAILLGVFGLVVGLYAYIDNKATQVKTDLSPKIDAIGGGLNDFKLSVTEQMAALKNQNEMILFTLKKSNEKVEKSQEK
jgi:hypothetical protein